MTEQSNEKVYSEAEVVAHLAAELPHWAYENGWIRRRYRTSGWKATLMVVNTVGHLAEAAWHHPDLTVSYAFVIVTIIFSFNVNGSFSINLNFLRFIVFL